MARAAPPPGLLLLLLPLLAGGCASAPRVARSVPEAKALTQGQREAFLHALRDVLRGDLAGADRSLGPLLVLRPLHVPSHLLHQDLSRSLGTLDAALDRYGALAGELPGDAAAAMLLARVAGGPVEGRIAAYQAAAVLGPSSPWPRIALGTARAELARDLQGRAEGRDRAGYAEEAEALRAEARAAAERACTEAERAVALAPDLAASQAALAHALGVAASLTAGGDAERRRLRARAGECWDRSLAIDPGDPRVLLGRALLRRDAGRPAEAQGDLDAAARAAPRDPAVLSIRARNLDDQGLQAEAARAWEAAVRAAPADAEVRTDFASSLARAGRWEEALGAWRKADALFAGSGGERWKARRGLATGLAQLGLERKDPALLAEALVHLRAYQAEGGPDASWATRLGEVLGEESEASGR